MIVLSFFLLSCLICWDNLSIVEGLLLYFFLIFQVETAQVATAEFLLACSY